MSFSFRVGGGTATQQASQSTTHLSDLRRRHIQSLESKCRVETVTPNSKFRVPFTAKGKSLTLTIFLPINFPQAPPVLSVQGPPMQHPWLEPSSGSVTGCHLLQEWSMTSDLGQVAHQVIRQLTDNPPHFLMSPTSPSTHSPSYSQHSHYSASTNATGHSHTHTHSASASTGSAHLPALPDVEHLIKDMSMEELEALRSSSAKIDEFVEGLDYTNQCIQAVEHTKHAVAVLAEQNLSMEPELNAAKAELKSLQDEIFRRTESVQAKVSKQTDLADQFNSDTIAATLAVQASEAEGQAEEILDKFHDDEMEVGEFVKAYRKAKKLEHARRHKERLYRSSINM
ncbi:hypothetical protein PTSG_07044 [Salpingoeca rosetta]|uniref:VPS37 C-terminal domain-containing protein n=1 Tax=Salpingoeca rosetta (strain ATCC 50818 / BSB-021) TaxID=946362 RepID=F2UDW1_SALR5|nr:uncharacterized protein PTSG_07044 [Salpingoeca rosetta]EGD74811.1 hypothetical protein PTSG_07044 [Salpingoeca rosetta]|eukprot:XP_004992456.1 hypothetical protein PTSG_07044 [Salpingoeca rosetta]